MQPRVKRLSGFMIVVGIAGILTGIGCARMSDDMSSTKAKMAEAGRAAATTLSGTQEVPPVNTQGTATSSIVVSGDKNSSGSIEVNGFNSTAAHVHEGALGQNGPVIIPLVKSGPNTWTIPTSTILSSQQFDAYQRGNLYVNVHSAANPTGEVRAQLKP
jgi:hypothetical protein